KLLVLLATLAIAAGGALGVRRLSGPAVHLVAGTAVLAFGSWLVTYLAFQAVAPRVAFVGLALWGAFAAVPLLRLDPPLRGAAVAALMILLNGWTLHAVSAAKSPGLIAPACSEGCVARR